MLKVLKSGFFTTVQDLGRLGFQHFGVPISGAMDLQAHKLANAILGNNNDAATLEMTMIGGTFQFLEATVIAISGASMQVQLNGKAIKYNQVISVNKDAILEFGKAAKGFRTYLAVKGGFANETVFESASMYPNITQKVKIEKADLLTFPISEEKNITQYATVKVNEAYLNNSVLSVFKGPEFDLLTKKQQEELFSKSFSVSKNNSRMAYQLNETLENNLQPIITSLVIPGTVQLTPSGQLIILMRDCQTTGGYPRILQLTETAINCLSQKFENGIIAFKLENFKSENS